MAVNSAGPLNRAFLCLGSNIQPEVHLPAAVSWIAELGRVAGCSQVWESAAVGDRNQPDFCNAAVLLETSLTAESLCAPGGPLRQIESALGRRRDPLNKNASRTIDLDLVLFNEDCLRLLHREIPDPDILTRPFVAVPLAEIAPDYVHPATGRTLREIADELSRPEFCAEPPLRLRADIVLFGL